LTSQFLDEVSRMATAILLIPFGLRDFRFHDLRHTCAAMLISQGAHPRAVMERLGHSSIKVTLDTYGHLFPALDESLTEGLEEQFQEAISSKPRPLRGLNEFQRSA
jgi:integrase